MTLRELLRHYAGKKAEETEEKQKTTGTRRKATARKGSKNRGPRKNGKLNES